MLAFTVVITIDRPVLTRRKTVTIWSQVNERQHSAHETDVLLHARLTYRNDVIVRAGLLIKVDISVAIFRSMRWCNARTPIEFYLFLFFFFIHPDVAPRTISIRTLSDGGEEWREGEKDDAPITSFWPEKLSRIVIRNIMRHCTRELKHMVFVVVVVYYCNSKKCCDYFSESAVRRESDDVRAQQWCYTCVFARA